MRLYRVFPWDPKAAPGEPGGALFTPHSTLNRINNPDLYRVLYVCSHAEGAVAEALGFLATWRPGSFVREGRRLSLATYVLADKKPLANLDDIATLTAFGVRRARDVITRDRESTQALARAIFDKGSYAGISWWSYYDPTWTCSGLWDLANVALEGEPEPIDDRSPVVVAAATTIKRPLRHERLRNE